MYYPSTCLLGKNANRFTRSILTFLILIFCLEGAYAQCVTPPTALCQDVTVHLRANGTGVVYTSAVDSSSSANCGVGLLFSFQNNATLDSLVFDCLEQGSEVDTLFVTDNSNSVQSSCLFQISIEDTTKPIAVCKDATVYLDATGSYSLDPTEIDDGSTDNCLADEFIFPNSFDCSDVGSQAVTLIVSADNGGTEVLDVSQSSWNNFAWTKAKRWQSFTATKTGLLTKFTFKSRHYDGAFNTQMRVYKGEGTGGKLLSEKTVSHSSCDCQWSKTLDIPVLVVAGEKYTVQLDKADGWAYTYSSVYAGGKGSYSGDFWLKTYVVEGDALVDTCSSNLTILDDRNLQSNCNDLNLVLNNSGTHTIDIDELSNGVLGDCTAGLYTFSKSTFTCSDTGLNVVTLYRTQEPDTCTFNVTVDSKPVAKCKDISVYLDQAGQASITATDLDNTSLAACWPIRTKVIDMDSFDCADVNASFSVTLTVTDSAGKTDNCVGTVTVLDNIDPVAVCKDDTVYLDEYQNAVNASLFENGSTDNCDQDLEASSSPKELSCETTGLFPVVLTVTDQSGNSDSCLAQLTVFDTIAPYIRCKDITVSLDSLGQATITEIQLIDLIDGNSQIHYDTFFFANGPLQSFTVPDSVTDLYIQAIGAQGGASDSMGGYGAMMSGNFKVDPGTELRILVGGAGGNGLSSYYTYCGGGGGGSFVWIGTSYNFVDSGALLLAAGGGGGACAYRGGDASIYRRGQDADRGLSYYGDTIGGRGGFQGYGGQMGDPIGSPLVSSYNGSNFYSSYYGNGGGGVYGSGTDYIGGGPAISLGAGTNATTTYVSYSASAGGFGGGGASGGSYGGGGGGGFSGGGGGYTSYYNTLNGSGGGGGSFNAGANGNDLLSNKLGDGMVIIGYKGSPIYSFCSGLADTSLSVAQFSCQDIGTVNVVLSATDSAGLVGQCTSVVSIVDSTAPNVHCPNDTTIFSLVNDCGAYFHYMAMDMGGGCSVTLSYSDSSGSFFSVGHHSLTVAASNFLGMTDSCSFTLTVSDTVAPQLSCPGNDTIITVVGGCDAVYEYSTSFQDNCGGYASNLQAGDIAITGYNMDDPDEFSFVALRGIAQGTVIHFTDRGWKSDNSFFTHVNDGSMTWTAPSDIDFGTTILVTSMGTMDFHVDGDQILAYQGSDEQPNFLAAVNSKGSAVWQSSSTTKHESSLPAGLVNGNTARAHTEYDNAKYDCSLSFGTKDEFLNSIYLNNWSRHNSTRRNLSTFCSYILDTLQQLQGLASGESFPLGLTLNQFARVDEHGNWDTCSFELLVIDTASLVPVCLDDTIYLVGDGKVILEVSDLLDNCDDFNHFLSRDSLNCTDEGSNPITVWRNDSSANCVSNVVLIDTVGPTAICQDVNLALNVNNKAYLQISDVDGGSFSNCGIASISIDLDSVDCTHVAQLTTAQLSITDSAGRSSSCTAIVNVQDTTPPVAGCKDITVYLDASRFATIGSLAVENGSTDNCTVFEIGLSKTAFDCNDLGSNAVVQVVNDAKLVSELDQQNTTTNKTYNVHAFRWQSFTAGVSGSLDQVNISTNASNFGTTTLSIYEGQGTNGAVLHSASISIAATGGVKELEISNKPILIAGQLYTIHLANGKGWYYQNSNSYANGRGNNSTQDNYFKTFVSSTATEANNTDSCSATVSVLDTNSLLAVCQDITLELDAVGNGSIDQGDVTNNLLDHCGNSSYVLSKTDFDCSNIGSNQTWLSKADGSDTCVFNVEVQDVTAPTAVCKDLTLYFGANGTQQLTVEQLNDGSSDACGIASLSLSRDSFDCTVVDQGISVTLTVTDSSGNLDNCNALVTAVDTILPTAICKDLTVYLDGNRQASIDSNTLDDGSYDNCSIGEYQLSQSIFDCKDLGNKSVLLTVVGNSFSGEAVLDQQFTNTNNSLTGHNSEWQSFKAAKSGRLIQVGFKMHTNKTSIEEVRIYEGQGTSGVILGSTDHDFNQKSWEWATFEDHILVEEGQTYTIWLENRYYWKNRTSDGYNRGRSGQSSYQDNGFQTYVIPYDLDTCTSLVTVKDSLDLSAYCQDITLQLGSVGSASLGFDLLGDGLLDGCAGGDYSLSQTSFNCSHLGGTHLVSLTRTQEPDSCAFYVTVEDTLPPLTLCKDIAVSLDSFGQKVLSTSDIDNGSFDACGLLVDSIDVPIIDCEAIGNPVTVTLTQVDSSGNTSHCTALVSATENLGPIARCKNVVVYLDTSKNIILDPYAVNDNSLEPCIGELTVSPNTFDCSSEGAHSVIMTLTAENYSSSLDQENLSVANQVSWVSNGLASSWQSFTPGSSGFLTEVQTNHDGSGAYTMSIYQGEGTSGALLATISGSISANLWYSHILDLPIKVEAGQLYTISIVNQRKWKYTNQSNWYVAGKREGGSSKDHLFKTFISTDYQDSCSSTVTVIDNAAPIANCEDVTVQLDMGGSLTLTPVHLGLNSTNDCGIDTAILSQTDFNCNHLGLNTVEMEVDRDTLSESQDQSYTFNQDFLPGRNQSAWQSFTAGESGLLSKVSIKTSKVNAGSVTIKVYQGQGTSGTQLYSGSMYLNTGARITSEVISPNVTVTAGQKYTIYVSDQRTWWQDRTGSYSGGRTSTNALYDFWFRTYVKEIEINSCNASVTVADTIAPTSNCKDAVVYLGPNGTTAVDPSWLDDGSTDNCAIDSQAVSPDSIDCADIATISSFTLTNFDASGNSSNCTANLSIVDSLAPVANCKNITVSPDINGIAGLSALLVDNGSSDNCGSIAMSIDTDSLLCGDEGSNQVVLTVSDTTRLIDQSFTDVSILHTGTFNRWQSFTPDNSGWLSQVDIYTENKSGNVDVKIYYGQGVNGALLDSQSVSFTGVTGIEQITFASQIPVTSGQKYTIYLSNAQGWVYSENDAYAGGRGSYSAASDFYFRAHVQHILSDNCNSTVTIEDTSSLVVNCMDVTVYLPESGNASVTLADVDAGSGYSCDKDGVSLSDSTFNCTDLGANTVTISATGTESAVLDQTYQDGRTKHSGGTAAWQSFTPSISGTLTNVVMTHNQTGSKSTTLKIYNGQGTGGTQLASQAVSFGSGITTKNIALSQSVSVTAGQKYTIHLANGNGWVYDNAGSYSGGRGGASSEYDYKFEAYIAQTINISCSATVTLTDTLAPISICRDRNILLTGNETQTTWIAELDSASTDNCGIDSQYVAIPSLNCPTNVPFGVTLTNIDASGNNSSCVSNITISDLAAPTLSCKNDTLYLNSEDGTAYIEDAWSLVTDTSENCIIAGIGISRDSFGCGDSLVSIGIWVWDTSGNYSDTCHANVLILDTIAPELSCPDDTLLFADSGTCSTSYSYEVGMTEPCMASLDSTHGRIVNLGLGEHLIQWSMSDFHGNEGECSFLVTVEDDQAPIISCPNSDTIGVDQGLCTAVYGYDVSATDNCDQAAVKYNLSAGDIAFTGFNMDDPDEFSFVLLVDVGIGTEINFTDHGWRETDTFSTHNNEGILTWMADTFYSAGTEFILQASGGMSFNTNGDQILAYQGEASDPSFIAAINVQNAVWQPQSDFEATSTLPTGLTNFVDAMAFPEVDNAKFNCNLASAERDSLLLAINDPNNWSSNDTARFNLAGDCITGVLLTPMDLVLVSGLDSGVSYPIGTTENIWAMMDRSGNTDTCVFSVTVQENIAPTVSCLDLTVYLDSDSGTASINDPWSLVDDTTENCGLAGLGTTLGSFSCADSLVTVSVWVYDASGNYSDTCQSIITVIDTTAPALSCYSSATYYLDGSGKVYLDSSMILETWSDNCGISSLQLNLDSLDCSYVSIQEGGRQQLADTIWITATDVSGNTSSCFIDQFTVLDTTAPELSCVGADTVYLDENGSYVPLTEFWFKNKFDNCGIDSTWYTYDTLSCAHTAEPISQYSYAVDGSGNISSCSTLVMVMDTTSPTAKCNDLTVYLGFNGQQGIVGIDTSMTDNGSYDNCGLQGLSISRDTFYCSDAILPSEPGTPVQQQLGSHYIMTAYDPSGNIDTCLGMVYVYDTTAPVVECANLSVYLDENGHGIIDSILLAVSFAYDYCEITGFSLDRDTFTCSDLASGQPQQQGLSVTVYAHDNSGNTGDCASFIDLFDTLAPEAICQDVTVYLNDTGVVFIDSLLIEGGSSDNCGIDAHGFEYSSFACGEGSGPWDYERYMWVYDQSDNSDSCHATVTVMDSIAPQVFCSSDTVYVNSEGGLEFDIEMLMDSIYEPCSWDSTWFVMDSLDCDAGSAEVSIYVNDYSGNIGQCMTTVSVIDTIAPTARCQNLTVYLDGNGIGVIDTSITDDGSYDNCDITGFVLLRDSFNCSDLQAQPGQPQQAGPNYQMVAFDLSGNTDTCIGYVYVLDTVPPVISCPANITVDADVNECGDTVDYQIPTATDNCGAITVAIDEGQGMESGSYFPIGVTRNLWWAYETSNPQYIDSCSFTITINNTTPLEINCPSDTIVFNDEGSCDAFVIYPYPTGISLCEGEAQVSLVSGLGAEAQFPIGVTTETWMVSGDGESDTCSFTVTVIDNEGPQIPESAQILSEVAKIVASDGNRADKFGFSVAIDSTTAIIGSRLDDDHGSSSGSAYIFEFDGNNWIQTQKLYANTPTNGERFGTSVDIKDGIAVVGSNGAATWRGEATVFEYNGTSWVYSATLTASDGSSYDEFGTRASLENGLIALGAPGKNSYTGAVYIYREIAGSWNQEKILNGLSSFDEFGISVDLDNGRLAVGASGVSNYKGGAYVFDEAAGSWNLDQLFMANDSSSQDKFGSAVSLSGDHLAVGSPNDDDNGSSSGSVYIWEDNGGWSFDTKLVPASVVSNNYFGQSLAIDNGRLLASAYNQNSGRGSVYEFHNNGNFWIEDQILYASDAQNGDRFGEAVDLDGDYAIVGAKLEDPISRDAGAAYIFYAEEGVPGCPEDIMVANDAGECGAIVAYSAPTATDNCNNLSINLASGIGAGGFFPIGESTELWIVDDGSGNKDTCTFTVTVEDKEAPVIICGGDTTVAADSGKCTAWVRLSVPMAFDSCSGLMWLYPASETYSDSTGIFSVGQTKVTWIAEDSAGNLDSCSYWVTVELAPAAILCPSDTVLMAGQIQGLIAPLGQAAQQSGCDVYYFYDEPGSTDTCSDYIYSLEEGYFSGDPIPIGEHLITWSVVDTASGDSSSCSFTVEVLPIPLETRISQAEYDSVTDCYYYELECGSDTIMANQYYSPVHAYNVNDPCDTIYYAWSNGMMGSGIHGVGVGTYWVTATDDYGQRDSVKLVVTARDSIQAWLNLDTLIGCSGDSNGVIRARISNFDPAADYFYSWSTGASGSNNHIREVAGGSYTVTIMDYSGTYCQTAVELIVDTPSLFSASSVAQNIRCSGQQTGSIDVTVSGGTTPYRYAWSDGPATSQDRIGLGEGLYNVTITDAAGCEVALEDSVREPDPLTVVAVVTHKCGTVRGSIVQTVSGGTAPYRYRWSFRGKTTKNLVGIRRAGTYSVTITDNAGCVTIKSYVIQDCPNKTSSAASSEQAVSVIDLGYEFAAYPNPFNTVLNISLGPIEADTKVNIAVMNVLGQVVFADQKLTDKDGMLLEQLDLHDMPIGTYMVRIEAGEIRETVKVIKQ